MDSVTASPYKRSTGLRHAQSLDNVSLIPSPNKKHWPTVDENCPLHGSHGKCTCGSFLNKNGNGLGNDEMGSSESLHRSGDFVQQQQQQYPSNEDLVSSSIKPFDNNPPLPNTQRNIVGNNLHFNSPSQNDWMDDENDRLAALLLYRDALKKDLTTNAKAGGGLPKMRHGRIGSQWRHIKQTNTYSGSNLMFIDGTVRVDDSIKYPIPRFGYPPMKRPQHKFSASFNDLSPLSSNPATQSLDTLTWSRNDGIQKNSFLSQHSSRLQPNLNDSFTYGSTDSAYRKLQPTNEYNEYEGKRTLHERVRPALD